MQHFASVAGAALFLASGAAAVATTVAYAQPSQSCVAGVHMVIARASTESQDSYSGAGMIGAVAEQVQKLVQGSDYVGVVYPATLDSYQFSEQEGVVGMKQLVTDYVSNCPGHKIALLGYSQGAMVVGDTVIGDNETNFSDQTTNPVGLGTNYLDQIVAIIQMGDPAVTTDTPGHVGTSKKDGIYPRRNVDAYKQYGFDSKMQTYCDADDLYCASGQSIAVHLGYVGEYGSSAASFIASRFTAEGGFGGGAAAATSNSGNGGSSSPAATSTAAGSTATAAAANNAASGSSSKAASSAAKTTAKAQTTGTVPPIFSSDRYHPFTGTFGGQFAQVGNLNAGGVHTAEMGFAGSILGFAMFVLGML